MRATPFISLKDYKAGYPDRRRSDWSDTARLNVAPYGVSVDDAILVSVDSLNSNALFVVTLSSIPTEPVALNFATRDGTAKARRGEYTPTADALVFWPGQVARIISVPCKVLSDFKSVTFFLDVYWPQNSSNFITRGSATTPPLTTIYKDLSQYDFVIYRSDIYAKMNFADFLGQ